MSLLRTPTALLLTAFTVETACAPSADSDASNDAAVMQSAEHDFVFVEVASGLINPFAMAFTPSGDLLVTERPGRLRIIRGGELLPDSVTGLPEIQALGRGARAMNGLEQAGLRDVMLHPDFVSNRLLYLSYVKPDADSLGSLAVVRGRFENDRLSDVEEIFHAQADPNGTERSSMWGGRIAFDGDGYLFVTLGDRQWPSEGDLAAHPAQDLSNHNGTTVRILDDGGIPEDNPFVGREDALPEIWTYGHRNAQGLVVHPTSGAVWLNEHGPQGGDELNLLVAGANYGWPVVGYGVNYRSGSAIHEGTRGDGMTDPAHIWVPSIGISGMMVYEGDAFPRWSGDVFVGGLRGEQLIRLTLDGDAIIAEETVLQGQGRIRDIRQSPDGFIYLAMDGGTRWEDGPATSIYRLEPGGRR
ncbi:MAG: PQQ-dependent sugar dehydrogenase [Gemmatimonadota bacterium]